MPKRKRVSTGSEDKDASAGVNYWLFKSEPKDFGFDHLMQESNHTACWDGVRNYQARNLMQKMKVGDKGFFYHSNAKKATGIAGTVEVVREAYPDTSAGDTSGKYFDPKHTADKPVWFMVDVKGDKHFESVVLLQNLKECQAEELSEMMLLKKGSRLSVQPVSKIEWDYINTLAE